MRKTDESQTSTYGSSYGRNGCVWKVETKGSLYGSNHTITDHRQQQYQYYNHDHVPQPASKTQASSPSAVAYYSVRKGYNKNIQSSWAKNERESKRQRRVAKYNTYTVESKVKSSIRNGFRWFKSKCGA